MQQQTLLLLLETVIFHKAFIAVDEEGTEAAAVTTIGISLTSAGPPQTPTFTIDKPFIFAIRERTTNTLLFIGQVVNPLN